MKKTQIWSCLALLFAISACSKNDDNPPDTVKESNTLKVVSYNIHHGTPVNSEDGAIELDRIATLLKSQNPDLIALQEVDKNTDRSGENQAEKLAESLDMEYFFSRSIYYRNGEYGVAVLSKYPIVETRRIELSNNDPSGEPRTVAMVTVKLPSGEKLDFASTHLDLVKQNRIDQCLELNEIAENALNPLIIAGDLNDAPSATGIKSLKNRYSFACQTNCAFTFPSDKPHITADYILLNEKASSSFQVLSYNPIEKQYASDHLPILGVYGY